MVAVSVTCVDLSVVDLRSAAKRLTDRKKAWRVLAVAMVLDGYS